MAQTNKRTSINLKLTLEIYPFNFFFSAGESDDVIVRRFVKEGLDDDEISLLKFKPGVSGRAVLFPGPNLAVIRVKTFAPKDPGFYACVHHELTHIVNFMMNEIGITLTDESEEAYTYLIGYLTKKIYEKIL